jgi:hypothetical protein
MDTDSLSRDVWNKINLYVIFLIPVEFYEINWYENLVFLLRASVLDYFNSVEEGISSLKVRCS